MRASDRTARKLATLGALVTLALTPLACNDDILVEKPGIIVADNLYSEMAGFEAGLNALYAQVRRERQGISGANEIMNQSWTVGTDNTYSNFVSPNERIWNEWTVRNNASQGHYYDVWLWLYQIINGANTIVIRSDNPGVRWTNADKLRIVAETRLIRAWAYRHLTYLWGDVPLNLTEASGTTIRTDWERTPRAEVMAQIEKDLLYAAENLPATSPNPGKLVKAVAQHYLAEHYLRLNDAAKAEAQANAVVTSGLYALVTNRYGTRVSQPGVAFMDQFQDGNALRTQGNTEVLWAFEFELNVPGGGGSIMRRYWVNRYYNNPGIQVATEFGGRGIGRFAHTRWSHLLYEAADERGGIHAIRTFYLYNDPARLPAGKKIGDTLRTVLSAERINNQAWPATRKWDGHDPNNVSSEESYGDQPYLRLAETLLLLAEAQFRQNKLTEAAATINLLRARAKASLITPAQVTLAFILDERSRELLTEEHRRYTLLRTGTWLTRVKLYNPLAGPVIVARDTIFPIPQAVIDANLTRAMPQNPGY